MWTIVCFPIVVFCVVYMFVHRTSSPVETFTSLPTSQPASATRWSRTPDADDVNNEPWVMAIQPWTSMPPAASNVFKYTADEITHDAWVKSLATLASPGSWQFRPPTSWVTPVSAALEGGTGFPPRIVLDVGLRSVAAQSIGGGGWTVRGVAIKESNAAASIRGVWSWDVISCFNHPGRARGWCARMTLAADARTSDPTKWKFAVTNAEDLGVVSESTFMLKPHLAQERTPEKHGTVR